MKTWRNTVSISSALFTIAFLWLLPTFLKNTFEGRDREAFQRLDWALQLYSREFEAFSNAGLAIILIGLIVTWGGFVKKVRWTWFVMFVIVWGWFFPTIAFRDFVYPLYTGALKIPSLWALIRALFGGSESFARSIAQEILIFVLLVIALVLPVKAFFWRRKESVPNGAYARSRN